MDLYTNQNAQTLLEHYSPILIGLSIEPPNNYPITSLEIHEYVGNKYRLICRVAEYGGTTIIDDVGTVADRHNLILPNEILENKQ